MLLRRLHLGISEIRLHPLRPQIPAGALVPAKKFDVIYVELDDERPISINLDDAGLPYVELGEEGSPFVYEGLADTSINIDDFGNTPFQMGGKPALIDPEGVEWESRIDIPVAESHMVDIE